MTRVHLRYTREKGKESAALSMLELFLNFARFTYYSNVNGFPCYDVKRLTFLMIRRICFAWRTMALIMRVVYCLDLIRLIKLPIRPEVLTHALS